jgi:uncharacterized protein YcbK (DUF882 family)
MALAVLLPAGIASVSAGPDDRTITLHHTHTGKTGTFTFYRDGKYDPKVLAELNVFLADWRNQKVTRMDPALFDLLWNIYREVGATQPINIVSSYRSPETNAMLRKTTSGVAENSQHKLGKAMDVFIPGVNLQKLREVAMRHQVGGVGYYPTSGSPFVHVDTGSVRAWPRMTRAQLEKVFPDGRTLHLPTDGKPLSTSGRAYAQAQWSKCHTVPCDAAVFYNDGAGIMLASAPAEVAPIPATRPDDLYGTVRVASNEPVQRPVATIRVAAPVPLARPAELARNDVATAADSAWEALGAPVPAVKSPRLQLATRAPLAGENETALTALAALDGRAQAPSFALVGAVPSEMVTAYVSTKPEPGAQLALRMIIERETTGALAPAAAAPSQARFDTAALGSLRGLFDGTFRALDEAREPAPVADALADLALSRQPNPSLVQREVELTSPEFDHIGETLVRPLPMAGSDWAVMTDEEGYLDKATELGPLSGRLGVVPDETAVPAYDRFVDAAPVLVATR